MRIDRVDKMLPGENVCTGCGACKNICPVNAIKMCTNFEGFLYPGIQDEKCIHCKRCEHVCPIKKNIENDEYEEYFAVQAKTDEKESTSGGIFAIIAKYVLSQGGLYLVQHLIKIIKLFINISPRKSNYINCKGQNMYKVKSNIHLGRQRIFWIKGKWFCFPERLVK